MRGRFPHKRANNFQKCRRSLYTVIQVFTAVSVRTVYICINKAWMTVYSGNEYNCIYKACMTVRSRNDHICRNKAYVAVNSGNYYICRNKNVTIYSENNLICRKWAYVSVYSNRLSVTQAVCNIIKSSKTFLHRTASTTCGHAVCHFCCIFSKSFTMFINIGFLSQLIVLIFIIF